MNPFYWDLNDGTRAFAKRFAERHPQKNYPNDMQAGVYSAVLHYLKAVDKVGRRRRRQGGGRGDEGDADRRSAVRQGHGSARTGARFTRCICWR